MIDTGVYFPLRVFSAAGGLPELSTNRKECEGFRHEEYFWCPEDKILPFQAAGVVLKNMALNDICSDDALSESELVTIVQDDIDGVTYSTYMGGESPTVPPGLYHINFGTVGVSGPGATPFVGYTDPFYVGDVSDKIKLRYRGASNSMMDNIYWKEGLLAECYINSVIEKPEYPILEETREDQEGDQHRIFQRWDKRHTIRFFGVESMADAMSLLPLMEYVEIDGSRVYDTEVTIEWDDERMCLAEITITFSLRKVVKTF